MTTTDRAEWLAERRKCLGGSEVAQVLGLAPRSWGGEWAVWLDKLGLSEEREQEALLLRASIMEHAIADEWCRRTGARVRTCEHLTHPEHRWAGGSPDRIIIGADGRDHGIAEVKSVLAWRGRDIGEDGEDGDEDTLHPYWVTQCQWYMWLTGLQHAVLVAGVGRLDYTAPLPDGADPLLALMSAMDIRGLPIQRDDALIAAMVERCGEWWRRHVVEGEPPPLDGSEAADRWLLDRFGASTTDGPVDLGDEGARLAGDYREARAAEDAAHERAGVASQRLMLMLGEAKRGVAGRHKLCRSVVAGKTTIDGKALKREQPKIFKKYSKTGAPHARLTVTEVKR